MRKKGERGSYQSLLLLRRRWKRERAQERGTRAVEELELTSERGTAIDQGHEQRVRARQTHVVHNSRTLKPHPTASSPHPSRFRNNFSIHLQPLLRNHASRSRASQTGVPRSIVTRYRNSLSFSSPPPPKHPLFRSPRCRCRGLHVNPSVSFTVPALCSKLPPHFNSTVKLSESPPFFLFLLTLSTQHQQQIQGNDDRPNNYESSNVPRSQRHSYRRRCCSHSFRGTSKDQSRLVSFFRHMSCPLQAY